MGIFCRCLRCNSLVCFVYQQFAVDKEEKHRVLVSFLEYPASTILAVDFGLDILVADLLLSKQFVVLVENLEVGIAVTVVDDGIHDVSTDGVAYHIDIIGILDVFVYNHHISHMIVIPVGVAVEPEARPEEGARRYGMPDDGVHVDHVVMIGMVEVGCRMHGAMRWRHVTTFSAWACVVVIRRAAWTTLGFGG